MDKGIENSTEKKAAGNLILLLPDVLLYAAVAFGLYLFFTRLNVSFWIAIVICIAWPAVFALFLARGIKRFLARE